ncbi:linear amide C-N hydrolase [bacterium]|nr:linear amide C-N hydrolase [bacterium]
MKHRLFKLFMLVLVAWLAAASSGIACTLFVINDDSTVFFGRTLDWEHPLPGAVFVNPRGLVKTSLPWHGAWPVAGEGTTKLWASVYGSVTFSAYGRDFVASGMNEAGLVIAEASWMADYAPADNRPAVSCAQWMQYQLDNFATVKDVVSHVDDLRLDGEGWHFMVADASGAFAVVESSSEGTEVLQSSVSKYPVLTNAGVWQLLEFQAMIDPSSGSYSANMAAGEDSYARYLRGIWYLRERRKDTAPVTSEDAWQMMDSVRVSDTRREIVFDATNRTVTWVTDSNRIRRTLYLADLSFEAKSPVLIVDVDAPNANAGDVAWALQPYSLAVNRQLVQSAMRAIHGDDVRIEPTDPSGFTLEQVVELIATHPR